MPVLQVAEVPAGVCGCGPWRVTWRMQSQNNLTGEFEVKLTCQCEVEVAGGSEVAEEEVWRGGSGR